MDAITKQLAKVKAASSMLTTYSAAKRIEVLLCLAGLLRKNCAKIMLENGKDLAVMPKDDPKYERLMLSEQQIHAMADDVELVAALLDPLDVLLEERTMPNGLLLQKKSVPLGVVAVIYESRPNVTIDVFALCFKSGNACILRGGKEAQHSTKFLMSLIQEALSAHDIDPHAAYLFPPKREVMQQLLAAKEWVDVCIPRGSQALIDFVREQAKIPVIETGAGIVHSFFDEGADVEMGRNIVLNAKTRKVSVCNALDTLIVHEQALPFLFNIVELLIAKQVRIFADAQSYKVLKGNYPTTLLQKAKKSDFGLEFLSYQMSIKTVASVQEAIVHIAEYTSGHSEAIISNNQENIAYFLNQVDAAVVYVNASTAFTDGGQFGMGAEIGISTQKLHARGPMGLNALTSYKWLVWGDGQVR